MNPSDAVAIGGSRGAFEALREILPALPGDYLLSIIIVIHQYRHGGAGLASSLQALSKLPVQAIEDKEPIAPGRVYVCPANYHALVERDRTFALSTDPPVNFARPAIDPLFESAARCFGERLVGVLLSGASRDGALGLAAIQARGGRTLCQEGALDPTMPEAGRAAAGVIGSPSAIGLILAGLRP